MSKEEEEEEGEEEENTMALPIVLGTARTGILISRVSSLPPHGPSRLPNRPFVSRPLRMSFSLMSSSLISFVEKTLLAKLLAIERL